MGWLRSARMVSLAISVSISPCAATADEAPLRIEEAVQLALSRNERARIARLGVDVAQAGVARARSRFLPVLSVNGSDTFRPEQLGERAGTPANVASGSVNLQQPLLDAAAFPLLSEARASLAAEQDQAVEDQRTLAFDAARAFFGVLTSQAVLQAAERRLSSARAALADAQARVRAQLASSNDATRAEVDLASAAREVESDRGGSGTAALSLGLLLDAPPPSALAAPEAVLETARKPVGAADALVRDALGRRLDLSALQHAAQAAHEAAREPLLRIVPTLGFAGSASATTNSSTSGRWSDAQLSLTLSWVLYDAGQRYADLRSRDASAQIADLQALARARTVEADVRSAAVTLAAAQAAYGVADKAVAVAHKNAEETAALYKQGLAKAIELIDANDQVFLAEVSDVQARYAMAQAYLSLRQTLGLDPLGLELP